MLGKRFPFYMIYEVGVNGKGVIQYLNTKLYSDYGAGGNEPFDWLFVPMFKNCYNYSTWNFSTYAVVTDMPPNAYTRAPGKITIFYSFNKYD